MNSNEVFQIINEIAGTGSRNDKEAILAKHIGDELMKQVVKAAYDPFITFGVKPKKATTFGAGIFDLDTAQVWVMLHKLSTRELTGNEAKTAVDRMLSDLEPDSSELLWRILNKDLKAGFTDGTVNRVLPGTIPVFDVMLSKVYEEKRIKAWPVAVEPKMDGLRAMGLIKEGGAKFFSRVGNHFPALDHLSDSIWKMVENAHTFARDNRDTDSLMNGFYKMLGGDAGPSLALDAEAITSDFYASSGDVKRKSVAAEGVTLHAFDAIPYKLLMGSEVEIKIPFRLRRAFTEFVISYAESAGAAAVTTPLRWARSHDEIMEFTEDHWSRGLEGSMVKIADAPYVKKKGFHWLKIKKEETEDLRVVGAFEGEPHTKYEGKLGGLIVDRNGVQVRVGGGFSDEQRELFWVAYNKEKDDPDQEGTLVLNRLIEVMYHEATPDGSLRHPRFIRFRNDKDEMLRAA